MMRRKERYTHTGRARMRIAHQSIRPLQCRKDHLPRQLCLRSSFLRNNGQPCPVVPSWPQWPVIAPSHQNLNAWPVSTGRNSPLPGTEKLSPITRGLLIRLGYDCTEPVLADLKNEKLHFGCTFGMSASRFSEIETWAQELNSSTASPCSPMVAPEEMRTTMASFNTHTLLKVTTQQHQNGCLPTPSARNACGPESLCTLRNSCKRSNDQKSRQPKSACTLPESYSFARLTQAQFELMAQGVSIRQIKLVFLNE